MPLPYAFISGEVAKAAQVNANFKYLEDLIGAESKPPTAGNPGSINLTGDLVLGPRKTATLSAEHDKGGYPTDFFQISWNAAWTKVGSTFKYKRTLSNVGGSSLRIGIRGLEFFATNKRTGDINTQLSPLFRFGHEDGGKLFYLPTDVYLSLKNGVPSKRSERRLTTVILDSPVAIYSNKAVGKGISALNAYNYGIPRTAAAIVVRAHVTASWRSGAGMLFYPRGGSQYHGLVAHATITGTGIGMRTGSQGIVPLGLGSYSGQFIVERTERFELANVHIIGYLV